MTNGPGSSFVVANNPTVVRVVVPGGSGPKGEPPKVSVYDAANVTPDGDGKLDLDLEFATTWVVALDKNVTDLNLLNIPVGRSQRIAIYFVQDSAGNRTVTGWPISTRWPSGFTPILSTDPGSVDCVVIDSVSGLFFGALVALDFRAGA